MLKLLKIFLIALAPVFLILIGFLNISLAQTTSSASSACHSCGDGLLNICDKAECEAMSGCVFQSGLIGGSCFYSQAENEYLGRRFFNATVIATIVDNLSDLGSLENKTLNFNIQDQRDLKIYKSPSCVIKNNTCSFTVSLPEGVSFNLLVNSQNENFLLECVNRYVLYLWGRDLSTNVEIIRNKYKVTFFAGSCPNPLETTCSTALNSPVSEVLTKVLDRATTLSECKTDKNGECFIYLPKGNYRFDPPKVNGFSYQGSSVNSSAIGASNFSLPGATTIDLFFKKNLYSGQVYCRGYQAGDKIEIFRGSLKIADFPVSTIYSHSIKLESDILYTAAVSGPGLSPMRKDFSIGKKIWGLTFSELNFLCLPKKALTTIIPVEATSGNGLAAVMVMVRLQGSSLNDYSCISDGTERTCNLNLSAGEYEAYILNDSFHQCWSENGCPVRFAVQENNGPIVYLPLISSNLSLLKANYCQKIGDAGNIFQKSAVKFFDYQAKSTHSCIDACVGQHPFSKVEECVCGTSMYEKKLTDCEFGCTDGACLRNCEKIFGKGYVCSPSPSYVEGYAVWPESFKDICPTKAEPFQSKQLSQGEFCDNQGNNTCVLCEEKETCSNPQDCVKLQCLSNQEKACSNGDCVCVTSSVAQQVSGKSSPCFSLGDVMPDGVINESDIAQAQRCVGQNCNAFNWIRSEITGDGQVTREDINRIRDYVDGRIETFPVCSMPEFQKRVILINPGGKLSYNTNVRIQLGEYYDITWYSWGVDRVDIDLLVYDEQNNYLGSLNIAKNIPPSAGWGIAGTDQGRFFWKVKKPTGIGGDNIDFRQLKYKVRVQDSVGTAQDKTENYFTIFSRAISLRDYCSQCGSLFSCKEDGCSIFGGCVFSPSLGGLMGSCEPQSECGCPSYYYPVCGNDEKTYFNECYAQCASASIQYEDPCIPKIRTNISAGVPYSKIKITEARSNQEVSSLTVDGEGKAIVNLPAKILGRMFEFAKYKVEVLEQEKYNCSDVINANCQAYMEANQTMIDRNSQWWISLRFVRQNSQAVLLNCGDCGAGILNICDKQECESNSNCLFESGIIGGVCLNCSCDAVFNPVCGENGKTYNNACLARCAGIDNYSAGACQQTGKVNFLINERGTDNNISGARVIISNSLGGAALYSCLTDSKGNCSVSLPRSENSYYAFVEKIGYECLSYSSCYKSFVLNSNQNLYFILSPQKIVNQPTCSDCGKNNFGYCSKNECLSLGDCDFKAGFIGGACSEKVVCNCGSEYTPVCANNGKSYNNSCLALCDNQTIAYSGVCKQLVGCSSLYGSGWLCGTEQDKNNYCQIGTGSFQQLDEGKICNSQGVTSCINCQITRCLTNNDCRNFPCDSNQVKECKNRECICQNIVVTTTQSIVNCSEVYGVNYFCSNQASWLGDCAKINKDKDQSIVPSSVCDTSGNKLCVSCKDAKPTVIPTTTPSLATTTLIATTSIEKLIQLVSPNGGEQWKAGETFPIQWTSQGNINRVEIRIYSFAFSSAGVYKIIAREVASKAGNNYYNWFIDEQMFSGSTAWQAGDKFKVEVVEYTPNAEYGVFDRSNNFVTIISGTPPVVNDPILSVEPVKPVEQIKENFVINLNYGWNIISSPTNEPLRFSDIASQCATNINAQGFTKYFGNVPQAGFASSVSPYEAGLVYIAGSGGGCSVSLSGKGFSFESYGLKKGWNLISLSGALRNFVGDCVVEKIQSYGVNNEMIDFGMDDKMIKTRGYWVKVANGCSLYPVN